VYNLLVRGVFHAYIILLRTVFPGICFWKNISCYRHYRINFDCWQYRRI